MKNNKEKSYVTLKLSEEDAQEIHDAVIHAAFIIRKYEPNTEVVSDFYFELAEKLQKEMMNVKAVMGSTFVIVRNYQYEGDFVIGHWIPEKRWFKLSDGDCYTADELLSDEFDAEFYTDSDIENILKEAMDK